MRNAIEFNQNWIEFNHLKSSMSCFERLIIPRLDFSQFELLNGSILILREEK